MKQIDNKDCSLINLEFFHKKFFNKKLDLTKVKNQVSYTQNGITLLELEKIAMLVNMNFDVFNCDFKQFISIDKEEFPLSCVIKKDNVQHMVIIKKTDKKFIKYFDPFYGEIKETLKSFEEKFLGIVLNFYVLNKEIKNSKMIKQSEKFNINFTYLFFRVISNLIIFIIPFISKLMISEFSQNYDLINLVLTLSIYSWIVFISFLIKRISFNLLNRSIMNSFAKKRSQIWTFLLYQDKNIKFQYSSYEIIDKINSYITILKFEQQFFSDLIINVVSIVFLSVFLFFINRFLIFCIFVFGIIYFLISYLINYFEYKNKPILNEIVIKDSIIQSDLSKIMLNSNTDQYKDFLLNKEIKNIKELFDKQEKTNYFNNAINDLSEYLNIIFPLLLITISLIQLWNGLINLNELIFFITCSNFIFNPLKSISHLFSDYIEYKNSLFKFGVFEESISQNTTSKFSLNNKITEILIKDVSLIFNGKNKLKIHNLLIDQNLILTGKNGIGKSLFTKIINNTLKVDKGAVLINKQFNVNDIKNIESKIYLLSNEEYFPNTTIKEYLFNCNQYKEKIKNRFLKYDFNSILKFYGLNLNMNILNGASNLSTGQKRLLSIIKLFTYEPDVIIFDEFFENLDIKLSNYLKEIIKDEFRSCIFLEISHNQNYIFKDSRKVNIEEINLI